MPITQKLYYLQNEGAGFVGNAPLWWAKGGNGYTPRLDDAEQFEADAANAIVRRTRGSHRWKKWSVKLVDSLSHRVVDIQDLRKPVCKKPKALST